MSTTPSADAGGLDILLVLWRELDDLERLIPALEAQRRPADHIHLALNDPTDEIRERVSRLVGPGWSLHEGPNTGYAGGLERSWRAGQAPWILMANTDLDLPEGTLDALRRAAADAGDRVGLIAPKILYPDGRLQSVAGLLLGPEGLARPRGLGEDDRGQYDHIEQAPIPSGCCCLVRRELLEDVGGFDPRFFMYVEDVDLALRALWAGWLSKSAPHVRVIHHHGGAAGRRSDLQLYYLERNHWWTFPWLPWKWRWALPWNQASRWWTLRQRSSAFGFEGRSLVGLALKACVSGIFGLPRIMWRSRCVPRRLSRTEFESRLDGHTCTLDEFLAP